MYLLLQSPHILHLAASQLLPSSLGFPIPTFPTAISPPPLNQNGPGSSVLPHWSPTPVPGWYSHDGTLGKGQVIHQHIQAFVFIIQKLPHPPANKENIVGGSAEVWGGGGGRGNSDPTTPSRIPQNSAPGQEYSDQNPWQTHLWPCRRPKPPLGQEIREGAGPGFLIPHQPNELSGGPF